MRYQLQETNRKPGTQYDLRDQRGKRVPGAFVNIDSAGNIATHHVVADPPVDWKVYALIPVCSLAAFMLGTLW